LSCPEFWQWISIIHKSHSSASFSLAAVTTASAGCWSAQDSAKGPLRPLRGSCPSSLPGTGASIPRLFSLVQCAGIPGRTFGWFRRRCPVGFFPATRRSDPTIIGRAETSLGRSTPDFFFLATSIAWPASHPVYHPPREHMQRIVMPALIDVARRTWPHATGRMREEPLDIENENERQSSRSFAHPTWPTRQGDSRK
jgi:hypothetical protein